MNKVNLFINFIIQIFILLFGTIALFNLFLERPIHNNEVISVLCGFIALYILFIIYAVSVQKQYDKKAENLLSTLPDAHKNMDELIHGIRFVGSQLIYLKQFEPEYVDPKYRASAYVDALVKSKESNSYYLLNYFVQYKQYKIEINRITRVTDVKAKELLSDDKALYVSEFGDPKSA